jgi:hypothetical protein
VIDRVSQSCGTRAQMIGRVLSAVRCFINGRVRAGFRTLYHCYLRNAVVYVPTVVKLQTGAYMDVDPVAVILVGDTQSLRRALLDSIARKNAIVSPPPKDNWPPPVLLKYAGVKTWSAFARGASQWSIEDEDDKYQIVGYRTHRDGYRIPTRRPSCPRVQHATRWSTA